MPKEFSLCKVSKIKEGLGKTQYFKSVSNDLLLKLCFDRSQNFVGTISFCPEYLYWLTAYLVATGQLIYIYGRMVEARCSITYASK